MTNFEVRSGQLPSGCLLQLSSYNWKLLVVFLWFFYTLNDYICSWIFLFWESFFLPFYTFDNSQLLFEIYQCCALKCWLLYKKYAMKPMRLKNAPVSSLGATLAIILTKFWIKKLKCWHNFPELVIKIKKNFTKKNIDFPILMIYVFLALS